MAANAESGGAEFSRRHARMLCEIVQCGTAVGIEVGDGRLGGVLHPTRASGVVERDRRARRLGAVIDLRRGDDESVPCESNAGAHHRTGQLKDVGVVRDARITAGSARRRDEHPHRRAACGDVDVLGCDDHRPGFMPLAM